MSYLGSSVPQEETARPVAERSRKREVGEQGASSSKRLPVNQRRV